MELLRVSFAIVIAVSLSIVVASVVGSLAITTVTGYRQRRPDWLPEVLDRVLEELSGRTAEGKWLAGPFASASPHPGSATAALDMRTGHLPRTRGIRIAGRGGRAGHGIPPGRSPEGRHDT